MGDDSFIHVVVGDIDRVHLKNIPGLDAAFLSGDTVVDLVQFLLIGIDVDSDFLKHPAHIQYPLYPLIERIQFPGKGTCGIV